GDEADAVADLERFDHRSILDLEGHRHRRHAEVLERAMGDRHPLARLVQTLDLALGGCELGRPRRCSRGALSVMAVVPLLGLHRRGGDPQRERTGAGQGQRPDTQAARGVRGSAGSQGGSGIAIPMGGVGRGDPGGVLHRPSPC
ncbi:hypothetical protein RZS08_19785, partial [Arthrospira platensis SPKY1]|nr:hypothetical protein [Arthrospira platensis SPKY1]